MILTIVGNIPNKKDLLRPGRKTPGKRGFYYDRKTKAAINGIVTQLQAQWKTPDGKQLPQLQCASVIARFYRASGVFDPDGQFATILDALKESKIIINDSALRVPEQQIIASRRASPATETTVVEIYCVVPRWPLPKPSSKSKRVPKEKQ